uniref:BTB domain-containing protein n=1 Tax=Electrophorus electricus TaxID=8005 RepID=A0AAY5EKK3_ELEEL
MKPPATSCSSGRGSELLSSSFSGAPCPPATCSSLRAVLQGWQTLAEQVSSNTSDTTGECTQRTMERRATRPSSTALWRRWRRRSHTSARIQVGRGRISTAAGCNYRGLTFLSFLLFKCSSHLFVMLSLSLFVHPSLCLSSFSLSLSFSACSASPDTLPLEPASGLGADLLALYERGEATDISIQVGDRVFSAHRSILCARSQYFRAMLCGSWMESSHQCITLQGLGPDEMEILLYFIYGAVLDLPPGTNVSQAVLAADMLGLDGLKDVAEMVLTRDYCRFFPKPVEGVQKSVLECLAISHSIRLESLYSSCVRWVAEHFVKCWSERSFALLPPELQRNCLSAVTKALVCLSHKQACPVSTLCLFFPPTGQEVISRPVCRPRDQAKLCPFLLLPVRGLAVHTVITGSNAVCGCPCSWKTDST